MAALASRSRNLAASGSALSLANRICVAQPAEPGAMPVAQAFSQWPQTFPAVRSPLAQRNAPLPLATVMPVPTNAGMPTVHMGHDGVPVVVHAGVAVGAAPVVARAAPVRVLAARLA